ncbi:AAA family ATPase [Rugamonas apoptosis]|uniref:AAA family ATPase n=1 Tax=Rugamonas apoptosis TaxID=2758570 RepID=A0A7W2F7S6_9BURK|nr:AAA family ATPase [Rugamonas apoptosis]MBA5686711.1 AAA family ATPase [Rugamonas apoptosis]
MQLIHSIEIAYFRSVYKFQLSDLSHVNVLFGRNDSGKSNVLRALNLFFDGKTNPNQAFDFARDFSHARQAEAIAAGRDADIRKFVYVKITFNAPANWRASLGERFWVKKQWSVTTGPEPQVTSSFANRKQIYLTRFLNKIRFHYIPAIKDRRIFEHLQAEIYRVVSRQNEFHGSLGEFAQALRDTTNDLTAGLRETLEINSAVSTPSDLTDLFRSLDFITTSAAGDSYSLTLQRGDGIQVRHIPPILNFLSHHGTADFNIWGFEEPENSLELANAIKEADTLRHLGRQANKQIFLTSHSPAFFMMTGEDVRRFFISRSESRHDRLSSSVRPISETGEPPEELMGETPHLPVISRYLEAAHAEIQRRTAEAAVLAEKVVQQALPIVFVEGESDKLVFEKAWQILIGVPLQAIFLPAGGTTKMEGLGKDGAVFSRIAPLRKVFALVDNDAEGRTVYSTTRLAPGGRWYQNNSNKVHWCRLPFEPGLVATMRHLQIPESKWPGSLENLFTPALRERAVEAGALALTGSPHAELCSPELIPKVTPYLVRREDLGHHHILTPTPESKVTFAEWVVTLADAEPEILESLRPLLEQLHRLLEGAT